jgi:hypothetical protein
MTLFINTERVMRKLGIPGKFGAPWDLVKLVCFGDADIDGGYFSEGEYAMLYRLAPKIQNAFEELDKAVGEARDVIKQRMEKSSSS